MICHSLQSIALVLVIAVSQAFAQVATIPPKAEQGEIQPWLEDPDIQSVLEGQMTVWEHILGEGRWVIDDFRITLDGPPVDVGDYSFATSTTIDGEVLVFQYDAVIDSEIDDPSNPDIPQDFRDWVVANDYRSFFVYGRATGPASGYFNPIGFAGYTFSATDTSGITEWYLVIYDSPELSVVDSIAEAEWLYQDSVATFGDLTGEVIPEPTEIAIANLCAGVPHDSVFQSCVVQAHANLQCRNTKVNKRIRNLAIVSIPAVAGCFLLPPTCLPSAGFLGVALLCLNNAKSDIPLDYMNAIDCCCNALYCRDGGGGGACQSNSACNAVGCAVPFCGS